MFPWLPMNAFIHTHAHIADKKDAATRALKLWTNRSLSSAWASWRLLVEWRKENEHVAREHAIRSLAYLQAVSNGVFWRFILKTAC